ncbi:MAG: tRNA-dihydrouridine synthase [Phycisphaerales bacterium]|nr:tRNA-dihydrouridine synthase [Phycisphaerales bacterium]
MSASASQDERPHSTTSYDAASAARQYELDQRIPQAVPGFDAPFFQAGLAGYSDAAMRIVARRQGCPFCVTEALLDRLLLAGGRGFAKADLADLRESIPGGEEDHPLAGQIIGSQPGEMARAAVLLADQGFEVIDVNLACPVKKIARKYRGGHFLAHPEQASAVLRVVREAVPSAIPCTVKLRLAWDDSPQAALDFERIFNSAYDLGYAWATVHARTVKQKYIGPSDWRFLAELTARYDDRVIFGSGDIWQPEDIFRMLSETGVKAVAVARGCIGNPWIFRQARQLMAGQAPSPPTIAEQRDVLLQHFHISVAINGERLAGRMMRKFGIMFSRHHPSAGAVKEAFVKVKSRADWESVVSEHYDVL